MARKCGKINKMSTRFEDYSYIINGVAGVGKTTLAYEIGRQITGSDEGTFIITLGKEPEPKHIPNVFYDTAPDFKTLNVIVNELCENKSEYPHTKFVAFDSLDELFRIAERYVIKEWNDNCKIDERAKTIKQAYKGFQAGENRVCDLVVQTLGKLTDAGYSLIEIGHTKVKSKTDIFTDVTYEQITCNLDNKYYNTVKDKVNLVATCYLEKTMENIKEKKNAFTKEMDKVGSLTSEKRVIVFRDDDMAIDTKSHFEYIVPKIEFSTANFIKAVQDAIAAKANEGVKAADDVTVSEAADSVEKSDDSKQDDSEEIEDDSTTEDKSELMDDIRSKFKAADADTKKQVKVILKEKGSGKLDETLSMEALKEILSVLDSEE